ncbi:integral membrane protein [Pseudomonas sp. LFM046]|uniref:ZIP family metal transporter n=1 Tax=Pseudomonas sp. LFM046 TaxID=1608357 RepID=UPI0005CFC12A|nr:integral membrane protein [Pseudomonas sp. LFM046]
MQIPVTLQAGLWGWLAASSLLIGAGIGFLVTLPKKVLASIMAYGSGVLVAALCFGQIPEAERIGGLLPTLGGLLAGGVAFVLASQYIERLEHRHRGKSSNGGSGMVAMLIAVGAFLDGIPESLGLGLGLLDGGEVSVLMLVAIFLANLPEGLASAAGLREEKRSGWLVFGLWGVIAVLSGLAAMAGPGLFAGLSPHWLAFALGFSAGAVLCMLVDTLIPEAFETTHAWTGLITLAGFMTAFTLDHIV